MDYYLFEAENNFSVVLSTFSAMRHPPSVSAPPWTQDSISTEASQALLTSTQILSEEREMTTRLFLKLTMCVTYRCIDNKEMTEEQPLKLMQISKIVYGEILLILPCLVIFIGQ